LIGLVVLSLRIGNHLLILGSIESLYFSIYPLLDSLISLYWYMQKRNIILNIKLILIVAFFFWWVFLNGYKNILEISLIHDFMETYRNGEMISLNGFILALIFFSIFLHPVIFVSFLILSIFDMELFKLIFTLKNIITFLYIPLFLISFFICLFFALAVYRIILIMLFISLPLYYLFRFVTGK
jgi:hypothetical protein